MNCGVIRCSESAVICFWMHKQICWWEFDEWWNFSKNRFIINSKSHQSVWCKSQWQTTAMCSGKIKLKSLYIRRMLPSEPGWQGSCSLLMSTAYISRVWLNIWIQTDAWMIKNRAINEGCSSTFVRVYLQEHVIEDEKHIYDLSGQNEDVKTAGWLVKPNTLQLTAELKGSYKTNRGHFIQTFLTNRCLLCLNMQSMLSNLIYTNLHKCTEQKCKVT